MLGKLIGHRYFYSPILKWKQGERWALRDLQAEIASNILPLVVMPPFTDWDHEDCKVLSPSEHIKKFGPRLHDHWGQRPILVDGLLIDGDTGQGSQDHPLTALFQRARNARTLPIPVTGLTRSNSYQSAVKRIIEFDQLGVGIRVSPADLECSNFGASIDQLLTGIGSHPEHAYLYFDLDAFDFYRLDEFCELLITRINLLPHLHRWKALYIASTEMPAEFKSVKPGASAFFRRGEWLLYEKLLKEKAQLARVPFFSDYAIEHPNFPPPRNGPIRASVHLRWTTAASYLVVKGPSGEGYSGIRAACRMIGVSGLTTGSSGDGYVSRQLRQEGGVGSPSHWRSAGTSHHITLVTQALAGIHKLPGEPATRQAAEQEEQQLGFF